MKKKIFFGVFVFLIAVTCIVSNCFAATTPRSFETDADRTYFTVILPVQDTFLHTVKLKEETPVKVRTRRNIEEIKELVMGNLDKVGNLL